MACPFGWTPAPQDGGAYSARCYASVDWASSLRECVKNCGAGAAPVCPSSAAENSLLVRLATDEAIERTWLGLYRSASGAFQCVATSAGEAPLPLAPTGYSNWNPLYGEPNNWQEIEPCVVMQNTEVWSDITCDYRGRMTYGCICGSPLNVSTTYLDDVARMEAPAEAYLDALRVDAAQNFGIAFLVSLLPMLIPVWFWCSRRCSSKRRVIRARSSVGDAVGVEVREPLDAADRVTVEGEDLEVREEVEVVDGDQRVRLQVELLHLVERLEVVTQASRLPDDLGDRAGG